MLKHILRLIWSLVGWILILFYFFAAISSITYVYDGVEHEFSLGPLTPEEK